MRGLSFCGALKYLEEKNVLKNIKRVAGSSAGSLFAVMIACKTPVSTILKMVETTNFASLKDDSWGYVYDVIRIINCYGMCKGDALYEWCGNALEMSGYHKDVTFQELFDKTGIELVITGTNLNKYTTEYFSHNTYPNMQVRLASRISSSIPLFFSAINMNDNIYVDGGVLDNYPIWIFDTEEDTFCIIL